MATQNSPIRARAETIEILRFPGTFSTGRYPRPKPFGGMGKPVDENGFSDHFPIGMQVTEADSANSPARTGYEHDSQAVTEGGERPL